tara:strand:+ start:480 stop:1637 length:1158 start_codon:yes stop_codon:yes gene_type:complete
MAENKEEVVEQVEETKVKDTKVEETKAEEPKKDTGFQEDGTYKVNLDQPVVDEKATEEKVEEPVEETKEETESPVLEEVTEEQEDNQPEPTQEVVEEEVEEKIEDKTPEMELPENIQKVVDFMNETGGTLEDYVRLNADYSNVDNEALLREYYRSTKPHLTSEEVNFMLEDNFSYDEEVDEPRDVKRKKLAYKEAVAQAKNHLEGLKSKYYQEVKLGSRLAPEQQKAIDFFNRYNKEQAEVQELNAKQQKHFNQETDKVFNENFKGFDFQVGDKKYRYNVKDVQQTKEAQNDVLKAFNGYISEENLLQDAKGYHKALFAARNADAIANHFYEQGKADAVKTMTSEAKNINLTRKTADGNVKVGNQKVRVISGDNSSSQKFKLKNY